MSDVVINQPETFNGRTLFRCYLSAPGLDVHGDKKISFFCSHCRCEHSHGWGTTADQQQPSHRAAHCHKAGSPYSGVGYYVLFDPDAVRPAPLNRRRRKYEFLERLAARDAEQDRAASCDVMGRPPRHTPAHRLVAVA